MIYVNPNWTYRESVEHIQALKDEYVEVLSSFSVWTRKDCERFVRQTRSQLYKLKLIEWQIEYLWSYMNDYVDYLHLKMSVDSKNGQKK